MMRSALWFVAAAVLAIAPACGDDAPGGNNFADAGPQPDAPVLPDASQLPDAGDGADAQILIDAPMDSDGPVVVLLSPTAPANLGSDQIVVSDRFTARCRVTANPASSDPVDTSSVRIEVIGVGGTTVTAFAQPTTVQSEFEASLSVAGFLNGALTVRCTAADLASTPRINSHEIQTNLDLGPKVTVFSPVEGAFIANAVEVVFSVTASPVASGDTGATPNPASVGMSIAGVDLTGDLTEDPPSSGVYKATVNFEDVRFVPALDGAQTLRVTAANTRTPAAVTRVKRTVFNADSDGPTILITDPAPAGLVSGIFTLTVNVFDPAGVDDTSVIATIAGSEEFDLSLVSGTTFEGSFDTRVLPNTMVFPTVVVRARDMVGNQSSIGQLVTLDNRPPLVSMDPPDMREAFYDAETMRIECSHAFDPVGSDAADDGESVPQLFELRARVEDQGNGATTGNNSILVPHAGVDDDKVQLFILDDSSRALIVDTDGDGVCDEIDPNLVPTSVPMAANEAAVVDFAEMQEAGQSNYVPPVTPPFGGGVEAVCNVDFDATDPPLPVCITSPALRIPRTELGTDAVIYSIAPQTVTQCLGNGFDALATNIADGWACLAVRVEDNLGNVNVSAPMRVCIDGDGDGAEGCPAWGVITTTGLDDCTGTYNASTGVTDGSTDCTPRPTFDSIPGLQLRRTDLN